MFLLTGFIKAWYGYDGKIKWTRIKCRLWFSTVDEMNKFVSENTEIQGYTPHPQDGNFFDSDNAEKWSDYCTKEMKSTK